jgi:hypothetical protein
MRVLKIALDGNISQSASMGPLAVAAAGDADDAGVEVPDVDEEGEEESTRVVEAGAAAARSEEEPLAAVPLVPPPPPPQPARAATAALQINPVQPRHRIL